ncbi:MAG TPA: alpha/beta hydrolase [Acidimicrobiales bacterium]|nr:alpha/beta hydrolase [Acidimicrobiales bacterium]
MAADVGGPEDGPTVVLLHGGGQTRHSWHGTWQVLVDAGWRAISLDLRGHGDSEWPTDGDYSHMAFAEDVVAVTQQLRTPPVLVGASLGGLASLLAVAEAPVQEEVARALVLVDVAHRIEEAGRDRIIEFMTGHLDGFDTLDDVADAIQAYNPHRPRPTDLSGLKKNVRERDGRWYWHWDPRFMTGMFEGVDETRTRLVSEERREDAARALHIPVLLVRGRSSDIVSEETANQFLALVPHAEFADVAGAGHMVAGDRNEIFNRAILDFLDRHR